MSVLEGVYDAVRRFNEQETEIKKQYYSRDFSKPFIYISNFDLYFAKTTNWRDTFRYASATTPQDQQDIPEICR